MIAIHFVCDQEHCTATFPITLASAQWSAESLRSLSPEGWVVDDRDLTNLSVRCPLHARVEMEMYEVYVPGNNLPPLVTSDKAVARSYLESGHRVEVRMWAQSGGPKSAPESPFVRSCGGYQ